MSRLALMLLDSITSLLGGCTVLAQERTSEWGWSMHPMPWMWGLWGLGMMLTMLIFWALVITAVVLLIRWFVRTGGPTPRDRALEILRERYARGEIDKNEFESKQRDLR